MRQNRTVEDIRHQVFVNETLIEGLETGRFVAAYDAYGALRFFAGVDAPDNCVSAGATNN